MANFIDVTNVSYAGKELQEILSRDLFSLPLRDAGVTYMDGLKGKTKIYTGEIGEVWQRYSCPFSPQGAASLAESYIEPVAIKSNLENCYDTYWNTFLVDQTSISLNGGIPQTFGDWFFSKYREKMAREFQEIFWQASTAHTAATKAYLAVTNGVETQLSNATGATHITGAVISVDNVISQLEAVIFAGLNAAGAGEYDTSNFKILMNFQDVMLLRTALGKLCCGNSTTDRFSNYAKEGDKIFVMGFEVVPTMQSKNTIIFGDPRNLVLGFDSYDSALEWKLIDMRQTTGDNAFRIVALANIGVGVVFPEGFVISKP